MPTTVITPATGAVLTAADVRAQCRIDATDEDAYLGQFLIPAVARMFEQHTHCLLLTTVLQDTLPCWPRSCRVGLAWGKVQDVEAVTYIDQAGAEQTLSSTAYYLEPKDGPGRVHLLAGLQTPALALHPAAVRVRYRVGFGATAAEVPAEAKVWMLAHIAHFWEHRPSASEVELKPVPFIDNLISGYCSPTI